MWKATVGYDVNQNNKNGDTADDWETDPDFINDVTEEEQRWGSKTVEGSGRTAAALNIQELRSGVAKDDAEYKKKILDSGPKASYGYGGKFGIQSDRMDKSAVGHDYISAVQKHASQTDAVKGFGGKYGVQADRQDKSAVGWDHHEKVNKHASQIDYSSGFGGKYGVQTDRVDRTAVGWDYVEKTEKHESQKDYAKGFGGKFGIDKEKQDKSAVGWEYHEKTEKHPSQKDYSQGFGGRYGVQEDRKDKSALGWDVITKVEAHPSQTDMKRGFGGQFGVEKDRQDKSAYSFEEVAKPKPSYEKPKLEGVSSNKASSLRARFENMARAEEEEAKKKAEEERARRLAREQKEKEVAKKDEDERQRKLSLRQDYCEEDTGRREPMSVTAVRTSVAVPTPLVQATNTKSASPETTTFHHPPIISQPPPQFEDDHEMPEKELDAVIRDTTYLEPVAEEPVDNELFTPPQAYLEPAYQTLEETEEKLYEETLEEGPGLSAIALYDYQAADSDEISFDPDDIITNIEMIDDGWWRGECRNQFGLFPANYVQLLEEH